MVVTHERSPSPATEEQPTLLKRMKMSHISESALGSSSSSSDQTSSGKTLSAASTDPSPHFAPELLHPNNIHRLNSEYAGSEPFKHAVVEKLFQDELLKSVKDEILSELSFTEKETDIYKVRPTYCSGERNHNLSYCVSISIWTRSTKRETSLPFLFERIPTRPPPKSPHPPRCPLL